METDQDCTIITMHAPAMRVGYCSHSKYLTKTSETSKHVTFRGILIIFSPTVGAPLAVVHGVVEAGRGRQYRRQDERRRTCMGPGPAPWLSKHGSGGSGTKKTQKSRQSKSDPQPELLGHCGQTLQFFLSNISLAQGNQFIITTPHLDEVGSLFRTLVCQYLR